ncbi:MAG: SUMF1/EgtB/PvdO family nonheme iron enzyme, partial [Verrucomicrobia bacterium]|nr:SUMF1/EgtB/PvdO family nonheme iron enzyme [Verrucomicrobiota bacterium]
MGSPHYISPEQAQGAKDIDFRADIYSLGCSLYHMLTGQTPYTGDSSMVIMMKHVHDPAPAIFKAWPACPMPLGMLVGKLLAKDRNARPQSYEQLIADLFAVTDKLDQASAPAPAPKPAPVESAAAATQALAPSPGAPTVALQPSAKPKNLKVICAAAGVAAVVALAGLFLWSPWKNPSSQDSNTPSLHHSASSAAALKQLGNVFTNAVGAEMVYIPPGEFLLGSTKEEQAWVVANGGNADDVKHEGEALRKATIKQGFWMGRTEVTVGQWKDFTAATGYVTDAEKK